VLLFTYYKHRAHGTQEPKINI